MSKYQIKLPSKLDAVRNANLLLLRGVRIGPAFPATREDHELGMHGQTRKKTSPPFSLVRMNRKYGISASKRKLSLAKKKKEKRLRERV